MGGEGFDVAFAPWARALTAEQRHALMRWQSDDGMHLSLQRRMREPHPPQDEFRDALIENILAAIDSGSVPEACIAWRGLRSRRDSLRHYADRIPDLVGHTLRTTGFFSTSLDEGVVRRDFLHPSVAGDGPVLLRLQVPAGVHGAWLPLGGDRQHSEERELLLAPGRSILIRAVNGDDALPILEGEVV